MCINKHRDNLLYISIPVKCQSKILLSLTLHSCERYDIHIGAEPTGKKKIKTAFESQDGNGRLEA